MTTASEVTQTRSAEHGEERLADWMQSQSVRSLNRDEVRARFEKLQAVDACVVVREAHIAGRERAVVESLSVGSAHNAWLNGLPVRDDIHVVSVEQASPEVECAFSLHNGLSLERALLVSYPNRPPLQRTLRTSSELGEGYVTLYVGWIAEADEGDVEFEAQLRAEIDARLEDPKERAVSARHRAFMASIDAKVEADLERLSTSSLLVRQLLSSAHYWLGLADQREADRQLAKLSEGNRRKGEAYFREAEGAARALAARGQR